MNLDATRARRGQLILEKIAEERVRRARPKDRPVSRIGTGRAGLVRREKPEEVAGQPAVLAYVTGTTLSQRDLAVGVPRPETCTHKSGPVLGKPVFTRADINKTGVAILMPVSDVDPEQ